MISELPRRYDYYTVCTTITAAQQYNRPHISISHSIIAHTISQVQSAIFQHSISAAPKMPLWTIYHPPSIFTSADTKAALAKAVTEIYTAANLPPFYVVVLFQPIEPESFYIGGVARPSPREEKNEPGPDSTKPMVRITIQNIARTM